MKTITLKKTGYYIQGQADLSLWGGGNASIEMTPFKVKDIKEKTLLENINDAGFGVEEINGAICCIYEDFEGTHKYLKTVEVGKVSDNTRETWENS
jgi:hypothetical protein